jgi:hypothetical protein
VGTTASAVRDSAVGARRLFDCAAFFAALDDQRRSRGLD